MYLYKKKQLEANTLVILATQEADIRRIVF
jgi:hypothetical protein